MSPSAMSVKMKFVTATVRDVSTGLSKPTRVKMVAEKYMSEFCVSLATTFPHQVMG